MREKKFTTENSILNYNLPISPCSLLDLNLDLDFKYEYGFQIRDPVVVHFGLQIRMLTFSPKATTGSPDLDPQYFI
jgi:hypothetical protein